MFGLGDFWDKWPLQFLKILNLLSFYLDNFKMFKKHLGNLSQITLSNMWLLVLILSQTDISSSLRWPWHLSMVSFDVKYRTEDFELLFVFSSQWSKVFGPSFSQSVILSTIQKNKSNSIPRWLCQSSKASRFWITFHVLQLMIWTHDSGPSFLKLP